MKSLDAARTFPSVFDGLTETAEPSSSIPTLSTGFAELGVPAALVRALTQGGITAPFPIQTATIPDALAGKDVLGRGQTGSGKTLAFGLSMIARIAASGRSKPRHPKGLVLVPTRELAMQVNDVLTPLAKTLGLFTKTAFGGAPYQTQIYALDRGVDILVATPGRLADLIEKGACSLDSVEISVLDEADQMADMGFLPDVTDLLAQTPIRAQRLLFSATLDGDVDTLVRRFLHNPVTHQTDAAVATVDTMAHHALLVSPVEKLPVLAAIANRSGRTIVFVKTQLAVDRLVEQFAEVGVRAAALHGGKTQRVRTRTLAEFREGRVNVLVATNVAARGIHVDGVSLVVHAEPPTEAKDYLHRAGRTARAGESGTVVTLVLPRQRRSTFTMLERAGVTPIRTEVTATAPALAEVTGARTPSGVPVPVQAPPPPPRDRRPSTGRAPYRDSRGAGDTRTFADRRSGAAAGSGARPFITNHDRGDRNARTAVRADTHAHPDRGPAGDRRAPGRRPQRFVAAPRP